MSPDKLRVVESFKTISRRVGKKAIGWRYDPVFYGNGFNFEKYTKNFEKFATALNAYTDSCGLSFLDLYEKVQRNVPGIYPPNIEEQKILRKRLAEIVRENGIAIRSCCEGTHLAEYGDKILFPHGKERIIA